MMENTTTKSRTTGDEPARCDFQSYIARRRDFHRKLAGRWTATVSDPFDILDPLRLSRSELREIYGTASAIAHIYTSFLRRLRSACDETLRELGIPAALIPLVRAEPHECDFPFLARVDIVRSSSGYKVLEINSEAPGFLVETFPICAAANDHSGGINPNAQGERKLIAAIRQLIARAAVQMNRPFESMRVAFSAHDPYERDREGAAYLLSLLDGSSATYVPLEQLSADCDGVHDATGNRFDMLFRQFSLRALAAGASPFGADMTVSLLARLIRERKLMLVNTPLGLLADCKAVQAAIWGLRDDRAFFSAEQQGEIERVMLPTFLDPPDGIEHYVTKPKLGFNGDTIRIINQRTATSLSSVAQTHAGQDMVYQPFIELPVIETMTEFGADRLSFLASCFLVDGEPCGTIFRAGKGITNYDWWLVPVTERCEPT